MATKDIFVGINRQLDPTIDELTGAMRDARALWALFTVGCSPPIPAERRKLA